MEREIVLWHELSGEGDTCLRLIEEVAEKIGKERGVKFKLECIEIAEFVEKLNVMKHMESGPDMVFIPCDMLLFRDAGFSEVDDSFGKEKVSGELWETMKYDGIQQGVPIIGGNHAVMYYNKSIFKEAPESWEDFKKIQKSEIVPLSIDLNVSYWVMPFISSSGEWVLKDGAENLNTDGVVEGLKFLNSLYKEKIIQINSAPDQMIKKFIKGEIGAIVNGEWLYNYLDEKLKENLGVCVIPEINGKTVKTITSTVGFAFPRNSLENVDNKEDIRCFINYMLSEECQKKWVKNVKRIPINSKMLNEIIESGSSENWKKILNQMENSRVMPINRKMEGIWNSIDDGMQLLIQGEKTEEEIALEMEEIAIKFNKKKLRTK